MPVFLAVSHPSSIVGYSTVDAPAAGKYKALSVQFENIGETTSIAIKDLFSIGAPKGAANAINSADQIWLWDSANSEWIRYYYRKIGNQPAVGWCKAGETTVTTDTVNNGETVFFYRGGGATQTTLTLSGAVREFVAQASYQAPTAGSYKFIGYPWPVALPIGGFEKYQGSPKGAANAINSADQIWLWDTENDEWIRYYYRKVGAQAAVGWCKAGETSVTTDSIPAGEGFFFYRGGGAVADTITFTYGD